MTVIKGIMCNTHGFVPGEHEACPRCAEAAAAAAAPGKPMECYAPSDSMTVSRLGKQLCKHDTDCDCPYCTRFIAAAVERPPAKCLVPTPKDVQKERESPCTPSGEPKPVTCAATAPAAAAKQKPQLFDVLFAIGVFCPLIVFTMCASIMVFTSKNARLSTPEVMPESPGPPDLPSPLILPDYPHCVILPDPNVAYGAFHIVVGPHHMSYGGASNGGFRVYSHDDSNAPTGFTRSGKKWSADGSTISVLNAALDPNALCLAADGDIYSINIDLTPQPQLPSCVTFDPGAIEFHLRSANDAYEAHYATGERVRVIHAKDGALLWETKNSYASIQKHPTHDYIEYVLSAPGHSIFEHAGDKKFTQICLCILGEIYMHEHHRANPSPYLHGFGRNVGDDDDSKDEL